MAKPKNHEWSKARKLFYKQRQLWRHFSNYDGHADWPDIIATFNGNRFTQGYLVRNFDVSDTLHRMRTLRHRGFSAQPIAKQWLKVGYTYL